MPVELEGIIFFKGKVSQGELPDGRLDTKLDDKVLKTIDFIGFENLQKGMNATAELRTATTKKDHATAIIPFFTQKAMK